MTRRQASSIGRSALILLIILAAVAVPLLRRTLVRSNEALLKNCLYAFRVTIDEYAFDKKKAPKSLDDLVQEGYLREVPIDPITGSNRTWRQTARPARGSDDPGSLEIHSGSGAKSLDGAPYSEW